MNGRLRLRATGRGRLVECEIAPRMRNGEYSLGYSSSRMLASVIGEPGGRFAFIPP